MKDIQIQSKLLAVVGKPEGIFSRKEDMVNVLDIQWHILGELLKDINAQIDWELPGNDISWDNTFTNADKFTIK